MSEMPYEELLGWTNYFAKRPVGWRDDERTYRLLQAQGVKEKGEKLFSSLAAVYAKPESENMMASFKGSAMWQKVLNAQGGDKLEI